MQIRNTIPRSQPDVASCMAPTATGPTAATRYPTDCAIPETLDESPDVLVLRPKSMEG